AKPDWVSDPFLGRGAGGAAAHAESPLGTTFRAFQALTQRGKGGVYKALDLSAHPPRLCIMKEGRSVGELTWDNRDGRWRVRHEGLHAACDGRGRGTVVHRRRPVRARRSRLPTPVGEAAGAPRARAHREAQAERPGTGA